MDSMSVPLAATLREQDRRIGSLLVDSGVLSLSDAERVLFLQREKSLRFGEAALELGLLSDEQLRATLASQFDFPQLDRQDRQVSRELIAAFEPSSAAAEALRALRTQLVLRWFDGAPGHHMLAIVSPEAGEGRTYLAANLAVTFSQLGERVLLVDANLRAPRLHQLFGLPNTKGLSSVLAGLEEHPQPSTVAGLDRLGILTAGTLPPNPQELLANERFAATLHEFSQDFDIVLLDTAAAASCADADVVCRTTGAALLVLHEHKTRLVAAQALVARLRESRVELVGTVMSEH